MISDDGVRRLMKTLGPQLVTLDLFGCFAITDAYEYGAPDTLPHPRLTLPDCPPFMPIARNVDVVPGAHLFAVVDPLLAELCAPS